MIRSCEVVFAFYSWLWFLFFVIVAGTGILFQLQTSRAYDVEEYDRWAYE